MPDFAETMANAATLSEEAQKKAGTPTAGSMGGDHTNFVKTISELLESGAIDVTKPETFLHADVYASLNDEWKAKTDLAIVNMATLLKHIHEFYRSKQTPDACPQLAQMIEELWQMKERIEAHTDVFIF